MNPYILLLEFNINNLEIISDLLKGIMLIALILNSPLIIAPFVLKTSLILKKSLLKN